MRGVLDTNVLISSVISTADPHEIAVKGFNGEYQIVVSVATPTEFREILLKYPEKFQMTEEVVQEEVETVRYFAEFVDPNEAISAVEDDPDDAKFFETAVAGNVDFSVSGGPPFPISVRSGVSILSNEESSMKFSRPGKPLIVRRKSEVAWNHSFLAFARQSFPPTWVGHLPIRD